MDTPRSLRVINLWAEPGAGKSTVAAGLFHYMKLHGFKVELVTEYAKDATYQNDGKALSNQLFVLAQQDMRLWRLVGEVDYAITDSPLPLCHLYMGQHHDWMGDTIQQAYLNYRNEDFLVHRTKPYQQFGRGQTEAQARLLGRRVEELFCDLCASPRGTITGDNDGVHAIIEALDLAAH